MGYLERRPRLNVYFSYGRVVQSASVTKTVTDHERVHEREFHVLQVSIRVHSSQT